MANVRMCDRCGAIIYSDTYGIKVKCTDDCTRTLKTIGNATYDFDLCQKCINELVDWFNAEKKDGENK